MKVSIEFITSTGIREAMRRDSYTTAELLGTYTHPNHEGSDWTIRLYRACDTLVFETNSDPVWEEMTEFGQLAEEYKVNLAEVASHDYQTIVFRARDILGCGHTAKVLNALATLNTKYNDALARIATLERDSPNQEDRSVA